MLAMVLDIESSFPKLSYSWTTTARDLQFLFGIPVRGLLPFRRILRPRATLGEWELALPGGRPLS